MEEKINLFFICSMMYVIPNITFVQCQNYREGKQGLNIIFGGQSIILFCELYFLCFFYIKIVYG